MMPIKKPTTPFPHPANSCPADPHLHPVRLPCPTKAPPAGPPLTRPPPTGPVAAWHRSQGVSVNIPLPASPPCTVQSPRLPGNGTRPYLTYPQDRGSNPSPVGPLSGRPSRLLFCRLAERTWRRFRRDQGYRRVGGRACNGHTVHGEDECGTKAADQLWVESLKNMR